MFVGALIYNVLLATTLAWLPWLNALRTLSAGAAGLGTLAIPMIGVASAWLQLGERPTGGEAVGMALIISELAILRARRGRESEAAGTGGRGTRGHAGHQLSG